MVEVETSVRKREENIIESYVEVEEVGPNLVGCQLALVDDDVG